MSSLARRLFLRERTLWCVILLVVLSIFVMRIPKVRIHGDEVSALRKSVLYDLVLAGDFGNEYWATLHNIDKPLRCYIVGFSRSLGGYGPEDVAHLRWQFGTSVKANKALGKVPAEGLLWWGRLPAAIFSTVGLCVGVWFVRRLHSRGASLIFLGLVLANPLLPHLLGRVREEAILLACITLCLWFVWSALRFLEPASFSPRRSIFLFMLAAVVSGLAAGAKMNGGILAFLGPLALVFASLKHKRLFRSPATFLSILALSIILGAIAFATFVACNPFLWDAPIENSFQLLDFRVEALQRQFDRASDRQINGWIEWSRVIYFRLFQDHSWFGSMVGRVMNTCLFVVGAFLLTRSAWRWWTHKNANPAAFLYLLSFLLLFCVTALPQRLDWQQRYFVPLVCMQVFFAVAAAVLIRISVSRVVLQGARLTEWGRAATLRLEGNDRK
jgi:4-amino-4-deoxy-L-arabinose transferase-like glycosyltransferase